MDIYSEQKNVSFADKLKNAFVGPATALFLFCTAFYILETAELQFVSTVHKVEYVQNHAVEVSSEKIDPTNENKLLHVVGETSGGETLSDGIVTVDNAINLSRKVEMFQWVEDKTERQQNNVGGASVSKSVYKYFTDWRPTLQNSHKFKYPKGHENPNAFPLESDTIASPKGKLGAFVLGRKLSKNMPQSKILPVSKSPDYMAVADGYLYRGSNYSEPKVGDVRIGYSAAIVPAQVSVLARQNKGRLSVFKAEGDMKIIDVTSGRETIKQIVDRKISESFRMLWIMRGIAFSFIWIGMFLMLQPILVFTQIFPAVYAISSFVIALMLAPIAAFTTIVVGVVLFLANRPSSFGFVFLSVGLLGLFGTVYFVWRKFRGKRG